MDNLPTNGVARLSCFLEDRLAQLQWTHEDLSAAGGPATATMRKAKVRGGGLSARTLARLDVALGWQQGSAQRVLDGGIPAVRLSEQIGACSAQIDIGLRHPQCAGVAVCAIELRNFLLDVTRRLGAFYTESVQAGGGAG